MKRKIEKHYKLTVGVAPFIRHYSTLAHTETEARRECVAWADRLEIPGQVRLLRSKTKTGG